MPALKHFLKLPIICPTLRISSKYHYEFCFGHLGKAQTDWIRFRISDLTGQQMCNILIDQIAGFMVG